MSRKKQKPILTPRRAAFALEKAACSSQNRYETTVWSGVATLIRKSRFGKKRAEVLIDATPRWPIEFAHAGFVYTMFGQRIWDEMMLGTLDNCEIIFHRYGDVEIIPRPRGPGSCSMTLKFQPSC